MMCLFQDAISIAQQEFSSVARIARDRIALFIPMGEVEGYDGYIRIGQRVWTDVASDLRPYQIVDIIERALPLVDDATEDKIAVAVTRKLKSKR
jgi:hypothetical protein